MQGKEEGEDYTEKGKPIMSAKKDAKDFTRMEKPIMQARKKEEDTIKKARQNIKRKPEKVIIEEEEDIPTSDHL